jgi:hypothetical protein
MQVGDELNLAYVLQTTVHNLKMLLFGLLFVGFTTLGISFFPPTHTTKSQFCHHSNNKIVRQVY